MDMKPPSSLLYLEKETFTKNHEFHHFDILSFVGHNPLLYYPVILKDTHRFNTYSQPVTSSIHLVVPIHIELELNIPELSLILISNCRVLFEIF